MTEHPIVVIGGSISGLGLAVALAGSGRRVVVLEKDAAPLPATPAEAFRSWDRRGSPQTRHSHAFLARLHNLLRDRAPALLSELLANGAETLAFRDIASRVWPDAEPLPGDEDVTMLACRRITFEWVLRRYVATLPDVEFRDGVTVLGLEASGDAATGLPRVTGVRLSDEQGETTAQDASLVVDASGRRTKIGAWLADVGAAEVPVETEPCGIFYTSRFYELRDGAEAPVLDGQIGADLGYLKYGIFAGDSRIFSITLAASPDDAPLRAVVHAPAFDALAATLPATKPWVDPEVSVPITDVHSMTSLKNTRRRLVVDDAPLALGVVCAGDALIHTNPITGRGCSLAFVSAFLLADALREHPDDAHAFALAYDEAVSREIVPWYEAMRAQDRDAIEVNELQRKGEDPFEVNRADGSVDPKAFMRSVLRDGFVPALREDITVFRTFMRLFNLLEPPDDLMKDPSLLARVLAVHARRDERDDDHGPTREEVLARLEAVSA